MGRLGFHRGEIEVSAELPADPINENLSSSQEIWAMRGRPVLQGLWKGVTLAGLAITHVYAAFTHAYNRYLRSGPCSVVVVAKFSARS
jgi:hypothetical protein